MVDDRSGVAYMEYRCVYGEDAESALRFLFNAMAPKADPAFLIQGRPKFLYLDNGPVAKSRVFQNVMQSLDIDWKTHIPAGKDGQRVTARSKGKVERPFRTVKEAHEALYHFHAPQTEQQGVASEFGKNRTLIRVAALVMRGVLERVDFRLTYAPTWTSGQIDKTVPVFKFLDIIDERSMTKT